MDDYLILHSQNAETGGLANGLLTFYLDQQYYSNARGSICDVEMVMVNCSVDVQFNDACLVETSLPIHNGYNNENSQFYTMAILTDNTATQRIGSSPIYRTTARPQQITLRLSRLDRTFYDLTAGNFAGVFILKFSYENEEEEVKAYTETLYNTLA
jgi:hypothetical protein